MGKKPTTARAHWKTFGKDGQARLKQASAEANIRIAKGDEAPPPAPAEAGL